MQIEVLRHPRHAAELRRDRVTQAVHLQLEVRLHPRHAAELRRDRIIQAVRV